MDRLTIGVIYGGNLRVATAGPNSTLINSTQVEPGFSTGMTVAAAYSNSCSGEGANLNFDAAPNRSIEASIQFVSTVYTACDCTLDTDGDGTPDHLDTDSDNDGCPDAIEGGGNFSSSDIQNDTLTGGVDTFGIPNVVSPIGQSIGASNDSTDKQQCIVSDSITTVPPTTPTSPVTACPTADDIDTTGGTSVSCGVPAGYTQTGPDANGCFTFTPDGNVTMEVTTCVIAIDSNGNSDTTFVTIPAPIPSIDTVIVQPPCDTCSVLVCKVIDDIDTTGSTTTLCADPTGYVKTGPDANGCYTYKPTTPPTDTQVTCIVTCDVAGRCDTTIVILPPPPPTVDTVIVKPSCDTCSITVCGVNDDIDATRGTTTSCGAPMGYTEVGPDANGCYTYKPTTPPTDTQTTCIVTCDDKGRCDTTYVVILPVDKVIVSDTTVVNPDVNITNVGVEVEGNVSTNDIVGAGTTYSAPIARTSNPTTEVPRLNSDGTYTFTGSKPGVYVFEITVCTEGKTIKCPKQLLTITVLDTISDKSAPVANTDIASTKINVSVSIKTLANDLGGVGSSLVPSTVSIIDQPRNGIATADPTTGDITYTPNLGFTGRDTLRYRVCDNGTPSQCAEAFQIIDVIAEGVENTTMASDDYNSGEGVLSGNVLLNDTDPQGDKQTVIPQNITIPGKGTFVLKPDGSYTFEPESGFTGPLNIVYQVCDNGVPIACSRATLYLMINPKKEARIPNYFSPNGDGSNDFFDLSVLLKDYPNLEMSIYNRSGNIVYRNIDKYSSDWNGDHYTNGEPVPDGVYYYIINLDNTNKVIPGFVEVMRK